MSNLMSHLRIPDSILGRHDGSRWVWHLKRNISIAPSDLAFIFLGLCVLSLLIGFGFYWMGASLVLPFCVVEISALFIAYFYNAVHANDYEKLVLDGNVITIEWKFGFKIDQVQLVRSMTRLDTSSQQDAMLQLRQGTKNTYFGKFVHANLRPLLAQKISERLHLSA